MTSSKSRVKEDRAWYACTATGAREHVLSEYRKLTLREKVAWLEEAESVAHRFRLRGRIEMDDSGGNT